MVEDKTKEKDKETVVEEESNNESFDSKSLLDKITQEITDEDNKLSEELKKDVFTKDQVTEIVKEVLKKQSSNESKLNDTTESLTNQFTNLKTEYEQKLSDIKSKMDILDNKDVGSKTNTPVESDPFALPNDKKPLALNEDLGSHEKRMDSYSNATEEYSKRALLKWGVLRKRT